VGRMKWLRGPDIACGA